MELLFWRHSTASQKRKGTCTLYLRITVNGLREEIGSTSIKIHNDTWCEKSQRITHLDPLSNFKNEQLSIMEARLWGIYNELMRKNLGITAERIKRSYTVPEAMTYMSAFDLFQREYEKNPKIEQTTKDKLKTIKQHIHRFLLEYNMAGLLLEEFDEDIMHSYFTWADLQGNKESYIFRNARGVKRITAYAKRKKWIGVDPLADYDVGREKIKKPVFVDSAQLAVWRKHQFLSIKTQQVADLFVLYSRTGFHYQDLMQVIRKPDDYVMKGIDGKQWVMKPRQKTDVDAKVPIHRFPEIQEIVNKYGGWGLLPQYSNTKMNDWLKLCVAEVNMKLKPAQRIYPGLSVKHGRNSFCDYCLNELGFTKEPLMTMMGRMSAAELDRYVRSDERAVITAFRISDAAALAS